MEKYVDRGEAKQIIAQLADGTTWLAEVEVGGRLKLIRQLDDPGNKEPLPSEPPEAGHTDIPEPAEVAEEIEETEPAEWGSPESVEGEELSEGYTSGEVDDLIQQMSSTFEREKFEDHKGEIHPDLRMPSELVEKIKDPAFKARLSSIMKDNIYDRRTKGRTRGKLDMTRLYKVPTGSRSIFTQKQSMRGKHYSVVLLVDTSGSMSGRKSHLAAESTVFVVKQLTDLGIDVGVIRFSGEVFVLKDLKAKPDYDYIYSQIYRARGSNCDYQGMRRAYKMLEKAEGKKVMLMLSDGEPTGFSNEDTYDYHNEVENVLPDLPLDRDWETKESFHHLVHSQKDVSSYGIGIQEGGWQVPDHEVIHNVEDLKKTIIKAMRRYITRG